LPAVLAEVHVVLGVAVGASGVELHLIGRLLVAASASHFRVRAGKGEVRLLAVIELPYAPAVGRMASSALVAEAAVVSVLRPMTIDAGFRCAFVRARDVALFAGNGDVETHEWEVREVVIERDANAPTGWDVALGAVRP
jgi:hypothetical protein